jgi:DDE_Tnp_1-associated/Transposase DDE domain
MMNVNTANASVPSLYELFLGLPDPRNPSGTRHSLAAMLTLTVTAMLSGAKTLTDIAQFGRRRKKLRKVMGFTHKKSPCISTFHYLFKELDAAVFESTLKEWLMAHHACAGIQSVHMDGKALRGSRRGEVPGVHLLAVYSDKLGTALTEIPVDAKTNEHKAALELLRLIPLKGVLVSGDAMFAQREIAEEVIDLGGDYLLTVKDNQPSLKQALLDAFEAPVSPS